MNKELLEQLVKTVLDHLGVSYDCVIKAADDDGVLVSITGSELNHLIGYRGDTLNAFQHFLNSAYYNGANEYVRLLVDVNGYRDQRKEKLEDMAKSFIDRVRFFNQEVEMPALNPSERRLIHTFVAQYDDVLSESTGTGRDRRVVLKPKK
ncbi:MAG: R3H domain-containing nucleic acid-binding protein [bacterium]